MTLDGLLLPSRSLSPEELRKGRSESVAADLSVMKLMPNSTGGCGPTFLTMVTLLVAGFFIFLFLFQLDRVASMVIRYRDRFVARELRKRRSK